MKRILLATLACLLFGHAAATAAEPLASARERFSDPKVKEVPDFQKHVLPLMGRLGCNGRACHGSFQGQGGFRLSLFGYDFKADLEAMMTGDEPRINVKQPLASLILQKPTLAVDHDGGRRMDVDSWQYRVMANWLSAGAKGVKDEGDLFDRLEVQPAHILFKKAGDTAQLKVIAHWADGSSEVVTPLCRFRTNDESIAEVDEDGKITALGPGDTHIVAFYENGVMPVQVLLPVSDMVGKKYPQVVTRTKVDELVVAKLRQLGVVPSEVATDEEFLRRVSLDMTGTLPTPEEIIAFLADKSPNKRQMKVNELLERPEYVAWWTTKFADYVGISDSNMQEQFMPKEQSRHFYDWVAKRLQDNVGYDKLVEGLVLATNRRPGQSFNEYCEEYSSYFQKDGPSFADRETAPHFWMRRNARLAEEKALAFSYTFLGVRLQCAQCHKHPFDQWTQQDFVQFQAFFSGITYGARPEDRDERKKLEEALVLGDKKTLNGGDLRRELQKHLMAGKTVPWNEVYVRTSTAARGGPKKAKQPVAGGRVITPKVLGGEEVLLNEYPDPRLALMEWMRSKDNPYFARSIVNRIWAHYFNVGIIEPADDLNLANPPSNEALLDYLTHEFVAHGYDLKWLHREIVNSDTYQRSWQPTPTNRLDTKNFARAVLRRVPAEVAYDALVQATASSKELRQPIDKRMIGPGASVINRTGNTSYAMTIFGKPVRRTNCDCERSNEPSLLQTVFLRNDRELLTMLDRGNGWLTEVAKASRAESETAAKAAAAKTVKAKGKGKDEDGERDPELVALKKQYRELSAAGKKEQAKRILERLEHLQSLRKSGKRTDEVAATPAYDEVKLSTPDQERLVREAYLRTLSRMPTERELTDALTYVRGSETHLGGLRDVLWALVNTKEFLVNH